MNTTNKVHIERKATIGDPPPRDLRLSNPLCGSPSTTFIVRRASSSEWFPAALEPTCEACILIAWTNPEKVYTFGDYHKVNE